MARLFRQRWRVGRGPDIRLTRRSRRLSWWLGRASDIYPVRSKQWGRVEVMLQDRLDEIRRQVIGMLDPAEFAELETIIERLRMLQLVEHGLAAGDVLPDFVLPDGDGRNVSSAELLARGPLVVSFFRGSWCPYCNATLEALNDILPSLRRLGASMVAIAPLAPAEVGQIGRARSLKFQLLSDHDSAYAAVCGVKFEMTDKAISLYHGLSERFGMQIAELDDPGGWALPIPATYVTASDGTITLAFGDADWSLRAEPRDIIAAIERLAQAAPMGWALDRGFNTSSTNALTGGE